MHMHFSSKNMDNLIEHIISQALIKLQDASSPDPTIDSFQSFQSKSYIKLFLWTKCDLILANKYFWYATTIKWWYIPPTKTLWDTSTSPCLCKPAASQSDPFQFSQFIIELFRCQTKLTHSTQWLHQQTTDTLNNTAKSSLF